MMMTVTTMVTLLLLQLLLFQRRMRPCSLLKPLYIASEGQNVYVVSEGWRVEESYKSKRIIIIISSSSNKKQQHANDDKEFQIAKERQRQDWRGRKP
jgi:hypothetical protein